ncbi:hypothetical protein CEXT_351331 [Caerostris extrusa]|uniref:Uncharacterized protein n=1 Tax=Caerostris extrusa TaxID=172846 RepID=A0AAV4VI17_CAEEX|nr:hypothetical protein CEXT_351331 [Caerostris extrusa]
MNERTDLDWVMKQYVNSFLLHRFSLGGGRSKNRLDTVPDEREGVVVLTRSDLGQGEGHRQGHGVRRLHLLQLQRSRSRHSGANRGDRREGLSDISLCLHYKHFLPGEFIQKEHHVGRGVIQENSPRALSRVVPSGVQRGPRSGPERSGSRIIVIKLPDLPKDDELPKEIQLYLKSTTYPHLGRSTSGTSCCTYSPGRRLSRNPKPERMADFSCPLQTSPFESIFPRLRMWWQCRNLVL